MRAPHMIPGILALLLVATSCDTSDRAGEPWQFEDDASTDTSASDTGSRDTSTRDTAADTRQPRDTRDTTDIRDTNDAPDVDRDAYSVTFELVNETDRPIFAGRSTSQKTCSDYERWLTLSRDGRVVGFYDDNCRANCPETVHKCTLECITTRREHALIPAGESRLRFWDAIGWTADDGCEIEESVVGDELTATFCYGIGYHDRIQNPTCKSVDFTVTEEPQTVRMVAEPREPHEIMIRLANESGRDLYAYVEGETTPNCLRTWYDLWGDAYNATPASACTGRCACEDIDPSARWCQEDCSIPRCPERTEETMRFPDGDVRMDVWDGRVLVRHETHNQQCELTSTPQDDEMRVTFCYSHELGERYDRPVLANPICRRISFDPATDDLVEHRIRYYLPR